MLVDGLPPLALGADEVERRVFPVFDDEFAGLDLASAAEVDVLGDVLLAVPAQATFL